MWVAQTSYRPSDAFHGLARGQINIFNQLSVELEKSVSRYFVVDHVERIVYIIKRDGLVYECLLTASNCHNQKHLSSQVMVILLFRFVTKVLCYRQFN